MVNHLRYKVCISKFIKYLHFRVGSTRVYNLIQLEIFQVEHLNNFFSLSLRVSRIFLCTFLLLLWVNLGN